MISSVLIHIACVGLLGSFYSLSAVVQLFSCVILVTTAVSNQLCVPKMGQNMHLVSPAGRCSKRPKNEKMARKPLLSPKFYVMLSGVSPDPMSADSGGPLQTGKKEGHLGADV